MNPPKCDDLDYFSSHPRVYSPAQRQQDANLRGRKPLPTRTSHLSLKWQAQKGWERDLPFDLTLE